MYIMAEFSTVLYIGSRLRTGWIFPNTGKYGPEKTPYLDTFYAVKPSENFYEVFSGYRYGAFG